MNILYLGSSSSWHVDLWVKYFTRSHRVYLFSEKEDYLTSQPLDNVTVIESTGLLGKVLNLVNSQSQILHQIDKLLSVRFFAKKVDKVIQKYDIDIVHAHSLYYGYLASFIKYEIPSVFTPMGSDVIIHAQENRIHRHMAQKAFNCADTITGDSILLQRQGHKIGVRKDKNYIVQNGVDSDIFFPNPNNIRIQLGVSNDEVLLFSPRAITPLYNIDIIVESLAHLKSRGYKFKCMFSFAYGTEYLTQLKLQISKLGLGDYIIWLGYLTYSDMAKHYNAADIVLSVPSSDSSPKSVYEAMFCKKSIIVSDLEWSYELLSGCNCFKRVGVRDAIQLTNAIIEIMDNSDYAKLIAENAIRCAHKYYDYEKNMKVMERLMLQSINGLGANS